MRVVRVSYLRRCRTWVEWGTVRCITSVMSHATRLQMCTVIQSALLPADATRDASSPAAFATADPTNAANSPKGRCTRTTRLVLRNRRRCKRHSRRKRSGLPGKSCSFRLHSYRLHRTYSPLCPLCVNCDVGSRWIRPKEPQGLQP